MPRTTACPSCGAALRPDAPWCTLCYTDLRPKPAPEPVAPPPTTAPATAAYGVAASDPLTQPLIDFLPAPPSAPAYLPEPSSRQTPAAAVTTGSWPCTMCEAVNPLTESVCLVCSRPFLAAMKAGEKPLLVLPVVGDLAALSRGHRLGLAVGAVLLLLVPLALITLLLTGRPSKPVQDQTPLPSSTVLHTGTDATPPVP